MEPIIREEPGIGRLECFPLPADENILYGLLRELFEHYWSEIVFGVMVLGAVFEIRAPNAPTKVILNDGYLTVDFGPWHFHVCIGEHVGQPGNPHPPEITARRRTERAELYRMVGGGCVPRSWGLRLINGGGEQQMTVFLPSPFLTPEMTLAKEPDWNRLALWNHLRKRYLGLDPDPRDTAARKPAVKAS